MKQNILTAALVLVIANLLFLNFHFFAGRPETPAAAPPATLSDMEAGLSRLEARLEERWAKKLAENTQSLSALVHEQIANSGTLGGSRLGIASLPDSLSLAGYRVGGQSSFGMSHIFAVKGDGCPAGSNPVNVPERQQAAAEDFIYCFYWRDSVVLSKRDVDQCPPEMKPVVKRGAPMREGEFFCRLLRAEEIAQQRADSPTNAVQAQ